MPYQPPASGDGHVRRLEVLPQDNSAGGQEHDFGSVVLFVPEALAARPENRFHGLVQKVTGFDFAYHFPEGRQLVPDARQILIFHGEVAGLNILE